MTITDDTFHPTQPILDDLTLITSYGGKFWPLKVCVVLEYSSQGANGVKERGLF